MLKIFACLVMLVDHVGYVFYPGQLWLRVIGRLAFPLFAWYVARGFGRTRSSGRYALRMLLWGLAAQVPFAMLFHHAALRDPASLLVNGTNVMFTFLFAMGAMRVLEWGRARSVPIRALTVMGALVAALAAYFANTDYGAYGVGMVLLFHLFDSRPRGKEAVVGSPAAAVPDSAVPDAANRKERVSWPRRALLLLSVFLLTWVLLAPMRMHPIQLYCVAAVPLTWLKLPDPRPGRWRYVFYAFYPAHLLALWLLA